MVKRVVDTIGLPMYTFRKFAARKSKNSSQVIGIPWYSEENWLKMYALADDKERFHSSYKQWLANTDKSIVLFTNKGTLFERIDIDPVNYACWCEKKSLKKDRHSRTAYTQRLLYNRIG